MADSAWLRFAFVTIALAAVVYLVRSLWELVGFASNIIVIIFLAWILASAMRRLVKRIRRLLPRFEWAAVPIAYLVVLTPIIAAVGLVVPVTLVQAVGLSQDLPEFAQRLSATLDRGRSMIESLGLTTTVGGETSGTSLTQIGTAVGGWLQNNALDILQGATAIVLQLFFVIALSVYMVVDGDSIAQLFYRLIPSAFHRQVKGVLIQFDATFFSYLRGVFTVVGLYSVAITAIMMIAGLPFALPIGLASGLIQLVPVVGEIAALGIPILVASLTGSLTTAILVSIALIAWSLVMNNVVLPRVLGGAVRMPGLFVLLAIVLGTRFAGPWGAVLGVPIAGFAYALLLAWIERGRTTSATADATAPAAQEEEHAEPEAGADQQQQRPLTGISDG